MSNAAIIPDEQTRASHEGGYLWQREIVESYNNRSGMFDQVIQYSDFIGRHDDHKCEAAILQDLRHARKIFRCPALRLEGRRRMNHREPLLVAKAALRQFRRN